MTELQPGQVTVADLYREMVGMRHDVTAALTRIEVIDTGRVAADKTTADHETRIRLLENARAKLIGAAAAVGGIVGTIGGLIVWALSRH